MGFRFAAPILLLATGCGLVGCQGASPFISPAERSVNSLDEALENDTVRFELSRDEMLSDPDVAARWMPFLFARTLKLGQQTLRESVSRDVASAERSRDAWLRCRGEILRLGPSGAEQCVQQLAVPGAHAALAQDLLTQFKPADAKNSIDTALGSIDEQVRRAAIRAAELTSQVGLFEKQIAGLTADPSWIVRREAALALASIPGNEARRALLRALDDSQLLVAREAAIALGRGRVRECGDALLRFLERARNSNDPTAVDAALTAFHALSGRNDLGADIAEWRQWVTENRPIVDSRPAAGPEKATARAPAPSSAP